MPKFKITEEYDYTRIVMIEADTEEEAVELYDMEPDNIIGKAKEYYTHVSTEAEELI